MKIMWLGAVFLLSCFQINSADSKKEGLVIFSDLDPQMRGSGRGVVISTKTTFRQNSGVTFDSKKLEDAFDDVWRTAVHAHVRSANLTINSLVPVVKIQYQAQGSNSNFVMNTKVVRFFHQLGAEWELRIGSDWEVLKKRFDENLSEYLESSRITSVIDITYQSSLFIERSFEKHHEKNRKKTRKKKLEKVENDMYKMVGNEHKGAFAVLDCEPA